MNFFSRQVELIFKKFELKFLVWALCFINLGSALYWKHSTQTLAELANVCWPIFKYCDNFVTPYLLNAMIITTCLSLLGLFLRLRKIVFPLLTLTFLLKLSLYLLNYSYSDNLHVLIFFIEIILFFFPLKSINIKLIILLFIFWSGLSKLNLNWLSGLEIKNYLPNLPIKGIEWVSAFVIILELVAPVILISKVKIIFHYAWVGLIIYYIGFAIASKNLVFLIPTLLVLYIVIYRKSQIREEREKLYKSYHLPEPSPYWVLLPVFLFFLVNWVPLLPHPLTQFNKNPIQLKKRQVPSECLIKTVLVSQQTHKFLEDKHIKSTGNDFKCYVKKHKNFSALCNANSNNQNLKVTKTLYSKDLTSEKFTKNFHLTYDCLTKRFL